MPIRCAVLATLAVLIPAGALAQAVDTPSRKITMIVGFAPGGGVDVLARVVAQELNDNAGFQIMIDTRIENSHGATTREPGEGDENEGQKTGPAGNE